MKIPENITWNLSILIAEANHTESAEKSANEILEELQKIPAPAVAEPKRPESFEFAMDFLGGEEEAAVREYVESLEARLSAPSPAPVKPAPKPVAPLNYVYEVPDHCDRIVWRKAYYSLPIKPHPMPATDAGELTDAQIDAMLTDIVGLLANGFIGRSIQNKLRAIVRAAMSAAPSPSIDEAIKQIPAGWLLRLTNWSDPYDSGWGAELFNKDGSKVVGDEDTASEAILAAIREIAAPAPDAAGGA